MVHNRNITNIQDVIIVLSEIIKDFNKLDYTLGTITPEEESVKYYEYQNVLRLLTTARNTLLSENPNNETNT